MGMLSNIQRLLSVLAGVCKKTIASACTFLKRFFFWLSDRAMLLAALATFALAFMTYSHVEVTKEMTKETKRLADLSIEQFKIKSYPTFLVELEKVKLESATGASRELSELKIAEIEAEKAHHSQYILQKFKITNRGEITAHSFTLLLIFIYQIDQGKLDFDPCEGTVYKSEERMTTINFETKIWPNSSKIFLAKESCLKGYNFDDLKNSLLFIKFKVPYDTKHRYETRGYILNKSLYRWIEISSSKRTSLVRKLFKISAEWSQPIKSFFVDYDMTVSDPSD